MKTHTKTPWILRKHNDGFQVWKESDGVRSLISEIWCDNTLCDEHGGTSLGNAAFIITACNAHEQLVQACKALHAELRRFCDAHATDEVQQHIDNDTFSADRLAREAIANAERSAE